MSNANNAETPTYRILSPLGTWALDAKTDGRKGQRTVRVERTQGTRVDVVTVTAYPARKYRNAAGTELPRAYMGCEPVSFDCPLAIAEQAADRLDALLTSIGPSPKA